MSRKHQVIVQCPACKKNYQTEITDSFNLQEEGGIIEPLINDEIVSHKCPHCGTVAFLMNQIMFHDMEKRIMVFFFPGEGGSNKNHIKQVEEMRDSADFLRDYRIRIVEGDYRAFKEKVMILENDYNDIACELYKRKLYVADNKLSDLLFVFDKSRQIKGLVGKSAENQLQTFAYDDENYLACSNTVESFSMNSPLMVNQKYIEEMERKNSHE